MNIKTYVATTLLLVSLLSSCSKRQIIPGIVAGIGGGMFASGVIYRATLPEEDSEGLLGRQSEQKATTAALLFTGFALAAVGIIWATTSPVCDTNEDCFAGDYCEKITGTCISSPEDDGLLTMSPYPRREFRLVDPLRPIGDFRLSFDESLAK